MCVHKNLGMHWDCGASLAYLLRNDVVLFAIVRATDIFCKRIWHFKRRADTVCQTGGAERGVLSTETGDESSESGCF